jgi:hypothetical protein
VLVCWVRGEGRREAGGWQGQGLCWWWGAAGRLHAVQLREGSRTARRQLPAAVLGAGRGAGLAAAAALGPGATWQQHTAPGWSMQLTAPLTAPSPLSPPLPLSCRRGRTLR